MEKVINEFRLIETDDGYRIEIKGDKERMKKLMFGGFRARKHWKRRGWCGPFGFGFGPMDWMHGDHEREHEHEDADTSADTSED